MSRTSIDGRSLRLVVRLAISATIDAKDDDDDGRTPRCIGRELRSTDVKDNDERTLLHLNA